MHLRHAVQCLAVAALSVFSVGCREERTDNIAGRTPTGSGTPSGAPSIEPATTLVGEQDLDGFGYAVDGAGDVDGDGFDDVLVGTLPAFGPGKAYLYRGSAQGLISEPDVVLQGTHELDAFGGWLAGIGDVNGDAFDDVFVSAPWTAGGGRVFVHHGSPGGLEPAPSVSLSGTNPEATWGQGVGPAGDVNGDGFADALLSAWYPIDPSGAGSVELYLGSAGGLTGTPEMVWYSGDPSLSFGPGLGVGDVNADGYDDLVVSATEGVGTYGSGSSVRYHPGAPTGTSLTPGSTVEYGVGYATGFGSSLAAAGDVNGDGVADALVGAPYYSSGQVGLSGEVFVLFGSPSGLERDESMSVIGPDPAQYFGAQMAGMNDLDGDGYGDVAVSAYLWYGGPGRLYLFAGSEVGLGDRPVVVLTGVDPSGGLGWSMANAGDVDGDGLSDLVAGAPFGSGPGSVHLYLGADLAAVMD